MIIFKPTLRQLLAILIVIIGAFFSSPFLDYQHYIAQGDHGRDFYAIQAVAQGDLPYQDFWWPYGPLMPYYYAGFYRLFDGNINSIMLASEILKIMAVFCFYLTLNTFGASPMVSFAGAIWFYTYYPYFFYTYNHNGGITLILIVLYLLGKYSQRDDPKYRWTALFFLTLLMFVKVNFGLANLLAYMVAITFIDHRRATPFSEERKIYYLVSLILMPLMALMVYLRLTAGLDRFELKQCFPFLPGYDPGKTSISNAIFTYIRHFYEAQNSFQSYQNFAFIILGCLAFLLIQSWRRSPPNGARKQFLLVAGILLLFTLCNLHEFIRSGTIYRGLWARPCEYLFLFFIIATALAGQSLMIQGLIVTPIILMSFMTSTALFQALHEHKEGSSIFLTHGGGKLYSRNSAGWYDTVFESCRYLNTHLGENESFLALPNDPLYYFLTNKKSPVQMLNFFAYLNIPIEQEQKIINRIKEMKIRYILVSNQINNPETGYGIFGKTHCQLLQQFIGNHFAVAATFGEGDKTPGWCEPHATAILKRIP